MAYPIPYPKIRFFDANGDPLAGGKLYSYEAGTTTPKETYTDNSATSANTNPVILDANGEADVWIQSGSYKFVLDDAQDVNQWTVDNVKSIEQLIADSINTDGALAATNNLSDLTNVADALSNLGISPLSSPVTTEITDSMSATAIDGYTFEPGSWVHVEYFVTRNAGAVLGSGVLDLHYDGSAWQIVEGPYRYKSGKASTHGLTFSMDGNALKVADANESGSGSLITKFHVA